MRSVWIALGLFVTLWWTWIGFAVLYNRHGADDRRAAAAVPGRQRPGRAWPRSRSSPRRGPQHGVRAQPGGHARRAGGRARGRRRLARRARRGSRAPTSPRRCCSSSRSGCPSRGATCSGRSRSAASRARCCARTARRRRARRDHDFPRWRPSIRARRSTPHHFAERFGLFLIILLGEVVISAGDASRRGAATTAGWVALAAAMVLAAALWWLYFDAAAEINLRVLELSGGSPTMARAIFAAGHMLPAFALILIAAGLGLLLEGRPADGRLLARQRRHRALPAGTRVFLGRARAAPAPGSGSSCSSRRSCSAGSHDDALAARVHLAADGLDGDVRRAGLDRHRGRDRAAQKSRPLTSTTPLAASQRTASCSACSAL